MRKKKDKLDVLNATEIHLKLLTYKLYAFLTKIKGTKLIDLTKEV